MRLNLHYMYDWFYLQLVLGPSPLAFNLEHFQVITVVFFLNINFHVKYSLFLFKNSSGAGIINYCPGTFFLIVFILQGSFLSESHNIC